MQLINWIKQLKFGRRKSFAVLLEDRIFEFRGATNSRIYGFTINSETAGILSFRMNNLDSHQNDRVNRGFCDYSDVFEHIFFCSEINLSPQYVSDAIKEYVPLYKEMFKLISEYYELESEKRNIEYGLKNHHQSNATNSQRLANIEKECSRILIVIETFYEKMSLAYNVIEDLRADVAIKFHEQLPDNKELDLDCIRRLLTKAETTTLDLKSVSEQLNE
jgi:hypothetical protein